MPSVFGKFLLIVSEMVWNLYSKVLYQSKVQ